MWFFAAVPSPWSSLNTWSPCSSVQTLRPWKPVALSVSPITSDWNPTPGRPGPAEQHRALQIDDRADPLLTEGDGVTAAGGIPGALELQPFAGRCGRPRRLRRRSAGRGGEGQAEEERTSRHVATWLSSVPRRACEESHVSLPSVMALSAPALALLLGPKLHEYRATVPPSPKQPGEYGGEQGSGRFVSAFLCLWDAVGTSPGGPDVVHE